MHRQILYLSQLAAQTGYIRMSDITQRAMARNQREGIRAALLFDGYRFVQLFEGPEESASALWDRLRADPRHAGIRLLVDTPLSDGEAKSSWPLGAWVTGYCDALEFDAFDDANAPTGQVALEHFHAILRRADLRP